MDSEFRVGYWLIEPPRNRIEGRGRVRTIKPKSMAVLVELARADGQVVSKQALMHAIWRNAAVSDGALTQCIVELRKAFGDSAASPTAIETIRRSGFRLLLPVRQSVRQETAGLVRRLPSPLLASAAIAFVLLLAVSLAVIFDQQDDLDTVSTDERSVAVLPFANLNGDPEDEYFSNGLAEQLLKSLASVPALRVPAPDSSFAFGNQSLDTSTIGRRLGVAHVLEGSVKKSSQRVQIRVRLINVRTGGEEWSSHYDGELVDLFAVQEDIAVSIVGVLLPGEASSFSFASPDTLSINAYDLYLLGQHELQREDALRAREFFASAIDHDPDYALAYAGLAETLLVFHETPSSVWQAEPGALRLDLAESSITRALELNDGLPEAHASLAALRAAQHDIAGEERALRRALELRPGFAAAQWRLAANLAAQRRYAAARKALEQAWALDPLNPDISAAMSRQIAFSGDYEKAMAVPLRLLEGGFESPQTYQALMSVAGDFGRFDEKIRWGLALVRLVPDRAAALAELGDAYMELGEVDLAGQWIAEAARLSPTEAFKARVRWLAVSDDSDELLRFAADAYRRGVPGEGAPLSPEQAAITMIYAISRARAGDYIGAVEAAERGLRASVTLPRRPAHITMYGQSVLAASYEGLGNAVRTAEIAEENLRLAAVAREGGTRDYPPLSRELAKTYALLGDSERALAYHQDAVSQGWRSHYLEIGDHDPVHRLLAGDARYQQTLTRLREDLARMRDLVRRNGWDQTPDRVLRRIE